MRSVLGAREHRAGVVDHLIDGHREGILMAVQRHAQTIADTDDIDTGTFRPRRSTLRRLRP